MPISQKFGCIQSGLHPLDKDKAFGTEESEIPDGGWGNRILPLGKSPPQQKELPFHQHRKRSDRNVEETTWIDYFK